MSYAPAGYWPDDYGPSDEGVEPPGWSEWVSVGGSMTLPQLYSVLGSLSGEHEVQIRAVRGGNRSAESDTKDYLPSAPSGGALLFGGSQLLFGSLPVVFEA